MVRMTTIRGSFADQADRASREQKSCRGLLAELLLSERDDRARRRSERQVKAAKFPREKSLRAFDFDANSNIDPAVVHTHAKCEWVTKGQTLCLLGALRMMLARLLLEDGDQVRQAAGVCRAATAERPVDTLQEWISGCVRELDREREEVLALREGGGGAGEVVNGNNERTVVVVSQEAQEPTCSTGE